MSFGLVATGFSPKSLQDCKDDLEAAFKASFGESIDVSPQSNFGQLIGIMAERYADLWSLGNAVYNASTPDSASGAALIQLAGLTGTVQRAASKSTVTITATGTPTTSLTSGRGASVTSTGIQFVTTETKTITVLTSWVHDTVYTAGNRRTNSSKCYLCITGGTAASSGGPTTTAADITDGTVHWKYLGSGTGAIDIAAEAVLTGPLVAAAGTLAVIDTAVSGWTSVTNLLDATLGTDLESDSSLRLRREAEIRSIGTSSVEALRADLLRVDGVQTATVFENVTDTTDGNSLPPHSVECLVLGGVDADVAAAVFEKAAGIQTYGTTTVTHTDSQGIDHDVSFSRPTEKNIYVRIDLTYDATKYPTDGDAQVKQAVVDFGDAQLAGKNVVSASVGAQAFKIPGVIDTPIVYVKKDSGPATSAATVAISLREIAVFDTSRITVNSSSGTP